MVGTEQSHVAATRTKSLDSQLLSSIQAYLNHLAIHEPFSYACTIQPYKQDSATHATFGYPCENMHCDKQDVWNVGS